MSKDNSENNLKDCFNNTKAKAVPDFVESDSSSVISRDGFEEPESRDILDLERIADYIINSRDARNSRQIYEAELRRCTPLADADFEEIKRNDKLLEHAYDLYFTPCLELAPEVKRKTEAMITRLESKPHFFCPYEREETTAVHVSRWLNNHTSNPEKELLGFTSLDPYEPKRFIPATTPRAVTSDTNVVLGKRKRCLDEECTGSVSSSSSESRLVCDYDRRPKKIRRRR